MQLPWQTKPTILYLDEVKKIRNQIEKITGGITWGRKTFITRRSRDYNKRYKI